MDIIYTQITTFIYESKHPDMVDIVPEQKHCIGDDGAVVVIEATKVSCNISQLNYINEIIICLVYRETPSYGVHEIKE